MAGTNTQIIGGVLKTVYEDFVAEAVNNKFPIKELFKWENAEYAGQDVVYTSHVTRNVSPMWVGEDSAFADAGAQGYVKVHIGQRKLMARVRLTSEAIHDSMKSEGAFKSARKDEMNRLIDDVARMEEYAFTADGRGVLALIADATPHGATTMTVDSPGGYTGSDFGNRFFIPGMFIAAVDPATGVMRTGISKIVSCASDGTSVTFAAVVDNSWLDNDYLVQAANSSVTDILDTSYEHAAYGLTALFDDGTYRSNYFNVDRNLYPQYQSYVKASTGTLSEDLFQQVADVVDQRLGGEVNLMTAHHSVRRLIIQLTQSDRRYSNNLMTPDAGTAAFTQGDMPFGGVPIKALRTHPLASIFGIDTKGSGFVRYGSDPGSWVDEDGSVLVRVGAAGSTGRDSFEAWYRKRYQNHVRYPGKNFRLDAITGQSLIVVREAGS